MLASALRIGGRGDIVLCGHWESGNQVHVSNADMRFQREGKYFLHGIDDMCGHFRLDSRKHCRGQTGMCCEASVSAASLRNIVSIVLGTNSSMGELPDLPSD
jgi:hypothetical protein